MKKATRKSGFFIGAVMPMVEDDASRTNHLPCRWLVGYEIPDISLRKAFVKFRNDSGGGTQSLREIPE
jgi:hypothetical protein